MTSRSLLMASSTSSSPVKLNAARAYAVFLPFGKNTVPGSASTPRSKALVSMRLWESPSSSADADPGSFKSSLNLVHRSNV